MCYNAVTLSGRTLSDGVAAALDSLRGIEWWDRRSTDRHTVDRRYSLGRSMAAMTTRHGATNHKVASRGFVNRRSMLSRKKKHVRGSRGFRMITFWRYIGCMAGQSEELAMPRLACGLRSRTRRLIGLICARGTPCAHDTPIYVTSCNRQQAEMMQRLRCERESLPMTSNMTDNANRGSCRTWPHAPRSVVAGMVAAVATVLLVSATSVAQDPCIVPDNPTGPVVLPPVGCEYLSPAQVHMIMDGLPLGTEIQLATIHKDFICEQPGLPQELCNTADGLGGENEFFCSTLDLNMTGTGTLGTFSRVIQLPVCCTMHSDPRPAGSPTTFPTQMVDCTGSLPVNTDPDFCALSISAGSAQGLPSPGQTTLTDLGNGTWQVDSFFDVTYQIDYQGCPGGALGGAVGTTVGTVRMEASAGAAPCQNDAQCDDGNACTQNVCDAAIGQCVSSPNVGAPCEDGDFCTLGDQCGNTGQCIPGADVQQTLCATDVDCPAGTKCGPVGTCQCPTIPAGDDCWSTDCGRTGFDFCDNPIPAGFFGTGSQPVSGFMMLGDIAGESGTRVRRLEPATIEFPGDQAVIPIEMVALSLRSCSPVIVQFDDGTSSQWDVDVVLSGNPQPTGAMVVTKDHANGGTFNSDFGVEPLFFFTRVDGLATAGPFAPGPVILGMVGDGSWVHTPNAATGATPCGLNFAPGISEDPLTLNQCCEETCHDGPSAGHLHCTKQCRVCPVGACCDAVIGGCTEVSAADCGLNPASIYFGDGTDCGDTDGDTIPDVFENNDCCQASFSACSTGSDPENPDTDGDGFDDGVELACGGDPCTADTDCNNNGQPDTCDLNGGTSSDDNGNGIPDECETCYVPAGDDCWTTPTCSSFVELCDQPIPAGFFGANSDAFGGTIQLRGGGAGGVADTTVRRLSDLNLCAPLPQATRTVQVEMLQLSLVSCAPITVNRGGFDVFFDVEVSLAPPQTGDVPGSMEVTKTHDNGGYFRSDFPVRPVFTFTNRADPAEVRVFGPPNAVSLQTVGGANDNGANWVHTPRPGVIISPSCGTNFEPGVHEDPLTLEQCCEPTGHAGPGHLHVTGEKCGPCPRGACCIPATGQCIVVDQGPNGNEFPDQRCVLLFGGEYKGDGTNCDDTDGDGIADWLETNDCCDPNRDRCNTGTNPNVPDTDGDGVDDGAELAAGTDPCEPDGACCLPDGTCEILSLDACSARRGKQLPPGTTCLGDLDGDGIDDACGAVECEQCGPGTHWIDQPACPAPDPTALGFCKLDGALCAADTDCRGLCSVSGAACLGNSGCDVAIGETCDGQRCNKISHDRDTFPSGALLGIDLDGDCVADTSVAMRGPVTVEKWGPRDDSANFPGLRPIDAHKDVIDTEMLSMTLSRGGVQLTVGAGLGLQPLAATLGAVAELPSDSSRADSMFDVFAEIRGGGLGAPAYNQAPIRVQTVVTCLPPRANYVHFSGCTPLWTSPVPGQGIRIGNLVQANHFTFPDCCFQDALTGKQVCQAISANDCKARGGTAVAACLGDSDNDGNDDVCVPPQVSCPDPSGADYCAQRITAGDCVPNDPTTAEFCLPSRVVAGAAGLDVQVCECFREGPGCGPVQIRPVPGTPFINFACDGLCVDGSTNCQIHLDGLPTGLTVIDSAATNGQAVTCDCPPSQCTTAADCPVADACTIVECIAGVCVNTPDPNCPCEPNADGTACNDAVCPVAGDRCRATCMTYDSVTGTTVIEACECGGPDDCRVEGAVFSGGAGVIAATGGPCVVADNGSGTVTLPPIGCDYLSPDEVHVILDGLPPDTTIEFAPIHKDFICESQPGAGFPGCPPPNICEAPGGNLGGSSDCFDSILDLTVTTTGPGLPGFNRQLFVPMAVKISTGPRTPGDAVQTFPTEMSRLQGQLFGDPDFCTFIVTAGSENGLPSSGETVLTRLGPPGSNWQVDSFFDLTYRIDYQGCPGSALDGMSGSTTTTVRMKTGTKPTCAGSCPSGEVCEETTTVNPDGTITICCRCAPGPLPDPHLTVQGTSVTFGMPDTPAIPADFFGPGSDPLTGAVNMTGGAGDTLIQRSDAITCPGAGFPRPCAPVSTEMVQLDLVSSAPITVSSNGGATTEDWDVALGLSINPPTFGQLSATLTHANGGTYDATIKVRPRFVFTKVSDPFDVRVLDYGVEGIPELTVNFAGASWVRNLAAHLVGTIATPNDGDFVPGVREFTPGTPATQAIVQATGTSDGGGVTHPVRPLPVLEACCVPDGTCQLIRPADCLALNGKSLGVASVCLGDNDGNGIDDACQAGECEQCGPGAHWIDSPACPAPDPDVAGFCKNTGAVCFTNADCATCVDSGGSCTTNADCTGGPTDVCRGPRCNKISHDRDTFPSGAVLGIDTDGDCAADVSVRMHGPATVEKWGPRDDSANFPGLRPIDTHKDVIDTEMLQMSLTGGGVTLTAGAGLGANPLAATLGAVAELTTDPSMAESMFQVFAEIDDGGGTPLYNQTPILVKAVVSCLPPKAKYIHFSGCTPLFTSPIPGQGVQVGNLVEAQHFTLPDCCFVGPLGTNVCQSLTQADCDARNGTVVPQCLGDSDNDGNDDACDPPVNACPEPPGVDWCAQRIQQGDCVPDSTVPEFCLPNGVMTEPGVGPVATSCACFRDGPGCGPVTIRQVVGATDFEYSCDGICPDGTNDCLIHLDGAATPGTTINSGAVAPGVVVTCECPCPTADPAKAEQILDGAGVLVDLRTARMIGVAVGGMTPGRSQAMRVRAVSLPPPWNVWNGQSKWADIPVEYSELPGRGFSTPGAGGTENTFLSSVLKCTPTYHDWASLGDVTVWLRDEMLVPSEAQAGGGIARPSDYVVEFIDVACPIAAGNFGPPLPMRMAIPGDIGELSGGRAAAPNDSVGVEEFLFVLQKFAGQGGAPGSGGLPIKPRVDGLGVFVGPSPELDGVISVAEITLEVDAFGGKPYPFPPTTNVVCP